MSNEIGLTSILRFQGKEYIIIQFTYEKKDTLTINLIEVNKFTERYKVDSV